MWEVTNFEKHFKEVAERQMPEDVATKWKAQFDAARTQLCDDVYPQIFAQEPNCCGA